jgi:hypothetical protein
VRSWCRGRRREAGPPRHRHTRMTFSPPSRHRSTRLAPHTRRMFNCYFRYYLRACLNKCENIVHTRQEAPNEPSHLASGCTREMDHRGPLTDSQKDNRQVKRLEYRLKIKSIIFIIIFTYRGRGRGRPALAAPSGLHTSKPPENVRSPHHPNATGRTPRGPSPKPGTHSPPHCPGASTPDPITARPSLASKRRVQGGN